VAGLERGRPEADARRLRLPFDMAQDRHRAA
jgi:hypothetical protein